MSRKRAHGESFTEDLLHIKFADDAAAPLAADRVMMSNFSTCVRGLPADAACWDLSQLVVQGQAVQRQTVVAWLNAALTLTDDEVFEDQEESAAADIAGLVQLLAFADAVGSSKRLLREICSQVDLQCKVQLGEQQTTLALCANRHIWYDLELWSFGLGNLLSFNTDRVVGKASSIEQRAAVVQQVAKQLEALLFLTHKLQLEQLQKQILSAVRINAHADRYLLYGAVSDLLSERVVAVTDSSRAALANGLLLQPVGLSNRADQQQLLRPVDLQAARKQPLDFQAEVMQDLLHYKKGEVLRVQLSLFDVVGFGDPNGYAPQLTLQNPSGRALSYPLQLLLGTPVADGWPFGQQQQQQQQ